MIESLARARPARLPAAIKQQVAAEVTRTMTDGRKTIRAVIEQRMFAGMAKAQAAKIIAGVIGLNVQQAQTVASLAKQMETAGSTPEEIFSETAKLSKLLLRKRAETIAEHELMKAKSAYQKLIWQEWKEQGRLRERSKKLWIAQKDACEFCASMDGEAIDLEDEFDGEFGGPPAHVGCRCTMALVGPERAEEARLEVERAREEGRLAGEAAAKAQPVAVIADAVLAEAVSVAVTEAMRPVAEALSSVRIEVPAPLPTPINVEVAAPNVTVAAPEVHVAAPAVTVMPTTLAADTLRAISQAVAQAVAQQLSPIAEAIRNIKITVNVAAPATPPAPVVNVEVPPTKVVVQRTYPKSLKVHRDAAGRLSSVSVDEER